MFRALLALTMLLVVLTGAGCMGGDGPSEEEFATQVRESRDRTDAALEHVTRAQSYDDLLDRIYLAGDAARSASEDLEETGAPSALEEDAEQLTRALRDLGDELSATADALNDEQFEGSTVEGLEFENWNKVQTALGDLRKQGVQVPPLARH
jgi:predicted  nucleic acid-binding Zn-ribbon protein